MSETSQRHGAFIGLGVALFTTCFAVSAGAHDCPASQPRTAAIISALSADFAERVFLPATGFHDWPQVGAALAADGPSASCRLIAKLRPIAAEKINADGPASELEVLWALRLLRLMTDGLDFRARVIDPAGFAQSQPNIYPMLARGNINDPASLRFFATRMSRDIAYLAPMQVQSEIIGKWQAWYAENGASFAYRAAAKLDDWYF